MTFRHSGDLGDILYSMAVIHATGKPAQLYVADRPGITAPISSRMENLAPLIRSQPYITEFELKEGKVDCDFVMFRNYCRSTHTLLQSHLIQFQAETDILLDVNGRVPWLTAKPKKSTKGKVIVSRTPRYNNNFFPWAKVVSHYGPRLLFVGNQQEHENFVNAYGWVAKAETPTLLHTAELIAGADLMIGNQSSPMAIAIGLGKPFIQEVCLHIPDCIYPRKNGQYVSEGDCVLPDVAKSGELVIGKPEPDISKYNRSLVPPGMWQYPGLPASPVFTIQKHLVSQLEKCDDSGAEEKLMRHNVKRVPDFFDGRGENLFEIFRMAHEAAFGPKITQPVP